MIRRLLARFCAWLTADDGIVHASAHLPLTLAEWQERSASTLYDSWEKKRNA